MSKRKWATAAAVGLLALLVPSAAQAQFYVPPATSPFYRPVISPYLNLARGGNPAINYYGIVRPQMQFAGSLQTLQQQVLTNQAALAAETSLALPATGHPVLFLNTSHYFFNLTGAGAVPVAGQAGPVAFNPNPYGGVGLGTALATTPNRTGMTPQGPRPIR